MHRGLADKAGEAHDLTGLAASLLRRGRPEAEDVAARALELSRELGDRVVEARALNTMAMTTPDLARQLDIYRQTLALNRALDDRVRLATSQVNLSACYMMLGLHRRSIYFGEAGVAFSRITGNTALAAVAPRQHRNSEDGARRLVGRARGTP